MRADLCVHAIKLHIVFDVSREQLLGAVAFQTQSGAYAEYCENCPSSSVFLVVVQKNHPPFSPPRTLS